MVLRSAGYLAGWIRSVHRWLHALSARSGEYFVLVMQTFSCRNSISLSFLVSSVVSVFFDFLVGECVLSSFILCLIFLRNVLLIRKCTFLKRNTFGPDSLSHHRYPERISMKCEKSRTLRVLQRCRWQAGRTRRCKCSVRPHNVLGQMLKHSNVFYKLFLGISFFRTYTGMERFFFSSLPLGEEFRKGS